MDVRVGEDVTLECRFNPSLMDKRHTFYWIRQNIKEKDNVAIGESPLEKNYRYVLDYYYYYLDFLFYKERWGRRYIIVALKVTGGTPGRRKKKEFLFIVAEGDGRR